MGKRIVGVLVSILIEERQLRGARRKGRWEGVEGRGIEVEFEGWRLISTQTVRSQPGIATVRVRVRVTFSDFS